MAGDLQVWLVTAIGHDSFISGFMRSTWGWPVTESLHFIGLCLLVGSIGTFDLRLLGVAKRVPIASVHHFIPYGLAGFAVNIATGAMFVLTEPDQYVYNPSFHLKLLFLTIAGLNAGVFYLTCYREAFGAAAGLEAPRRARVIAAISLGAWIAVIICGRMITFYRPSTCQATQVTLLLTCDPR
jgi:hypothetical protein